MPSKYIDDKTWDKVKSEFVRAVVVTKTSLKEADILRLLIQKGIDNITEEDYLRLISTNKKSN